MMIPGPAKLLFTIIVLTVPLTIAVAHLSPWIVDAMVTASLTLAPVSQESLGIMELAADPDVYFLGPLSFFSAWTLRIRTLNDEVFCDLTMLIYFPLLFIILAVSSAGASTLMQFFSRLFGGIVVHLLWGILVLTVTLLVLPWHDTLAVQIFNRAHGTMTFLLPLLTWIVLFRLPLLGRESGELVSRKRSSTKKTSKKNVPEHEEQ